MFTGLVQAVGSVKAVHRTPKRVRLVVDPGSWKYRAQAGDSVSVSGCCLTAVRSRSAAKGMLEFDVVQETLDKTKPGSLKPGSRVNLEHAATPTTLMGGHLVQGHVDGVGKVARVDRGADWRLWIALPDTDLHQYVIPKGSICIDGVSLTIASVDHRKTKMARTGLIQIALIPTTLAKTTLADLKIGDPVNLEADMMAKTIVYWLQQFSGRARA